ncbi:MAG: sigma-54-dependent Fis family transcriptional regulator [Lentisphaerae bacterium]|nr:sigma-54-dependent Fis family transcriptional regulator [Lentisphaerota bacterium]
MATILLIDDEPNLLSVLRTLLKADGYDVTPVSDGEKAQELISSDDYDLMISDMRMSPVDGMQLLRQERSEKPAMCVIMLTAYGTVETAIEAMRLGAFDYVTKPFKPDELLITVRRALEYNRAISENADLRARLGARYHLENIIAESPSMQNVCEMIRRVAPTDATVLITGESGTGKELVAKAIHSCSLRRERSFVAVNCAALPEQLLESEMFGHVKGAFTGASSDKEGLFMTASGGTIFLDEISSMPLAIQAKILRVLQEKEMRPVGSNENVAIDTRVLAAVNVPLEQLMNEGKFRQDLYYRLSVIPINIAPLRDRPQDILPLVYHILRSQTPEGEAPPKMDADVSSILQSYAWPGNVRELENAIKHAMTFADEGRLTRQSLPAALAAIEPAAGLNSAAEKLDASRCQSLKTFLRSKEKGYLKQVLDHTEGDKEKAAQTLKISLATLYRKMPDEEPDVQ